MDLPAPEISSDRTTGLVGSDILRSGVNALTTESVKRRKQKSPEQIERARDRQRLARRAKWAAKALRIDKDYTLLDSDTLSEESGEGIITNNDGHERDKSPGSFLGLQDDELQRMQRLDMSYFQAALEREWQTIKMHLVKEADKAPSVRSIFLRASKAEFCEGIGAKALRLSFQCLLVAA